MAPSDRWPVPNEPPPALGGPVFMGPLTIPDVSRKRRWGWLMVWTLLVFAGGVVAGPKLTEQALALVARAYSMLGMPPPQFEEKLKPAAPTPPSAPAAPSIVPLPASGAEEQAEAPAAAAEPVARQVATPAEPEKPAAAVAAQPAARVESAVAPGRAETPVGKAPVARPTHAKSEARTPSAKAAPTTTTAKPPASAAAATPYHDPFADDAAPTPAPKSGISGRKSRPSFDDPAPTAKSEPAARPAASGDSLDNLMADVVTEKKGKDKPRAGKSLDALLNDVQKGKPEPAPKREAPAEPASLSQADISRVMTGVKTRAKDCAKQVAGQKGIAEVNLVVSKDGNVTGVSVGGKLANTPVAGCIEKAARAASFPRSAGLRFDYRIDVR